MDARLSKVEWVFVLAAVVVASLYVWLVTSSYGAGVSSDSVFYLSSAENLARGEGLVDYEGYPFVLWPPLYPLLLGALNWASGVPALAIGRLLNAACAGLVVGCSALLFKRCFPTRPVWLYIGTLAVVLSLSLYTLAANIGTDVLFILLVLLFSLVGQDFLTRRKLGSLLLLTLLAASAAMLRWIGLAFILAEAGLIWVAWWRHISKAILYSLVFPGLAALPFIAWTVGRDYLLLGRPLGSRDFSQVSVLGNIQHFYVKIAQWLLPVRVPPTLVLAGLLLVLLVLILLNRRHDWLRWLRRAAHNPFLPVFLIALVYSVGIFLTSYTSDHFEYYDDRYQAPVYTAFFLGVFLTIDELLLVHLSARSQRIAQWVVVGVFALWSVYPASLIFKFTVKSLDNGVAAYNIYNTRQLRESGLIKELELISSDGDTWYSNDPEAVYFITDRRVLSSPYEASYTPHLDYLKRNYAGWPEQQQAYLIWLNGSEKYKRHIYDPSMLREVAQVSKVFENSEGKIYRVETRLRRTQ